MSNRNFSYIFSPYTLWGNVSSQSVTDLCNHKLSVSSFVTPIIFSDPSLFIMSTYCFTAVSFSVSVSVSVSVSGSGSGSGTDSGTDSVSVSVRSHPKAPPAQFFWGAPKYDPRYVEIIFHW